jgi:hypothetical protein
MVRHPIADVVVEAGNRTRDVVPIGERAAPLTCPADCRTL